MSACGRRTGSLPIVLGAALALVGVHVSAQAPPDALRTANAAFQEGVRHLDAGRFASAAAAFERAVNLHETAAGLYNLALARRGRGDAVGAIAAFDRFLARAREDHPMRPRALAAVTALRQQVGRVQVTVEGEGAELRVDGEPAPLVDGGHARDLPPGSHRLEVRWPDRTPARTEVTLDGGEVVTVPFMLPLLAPSSRLAVAVLPPPPQPPPPRVVRRPLYGNPWFWVGLGAGVVAVTATVAAVVVSSTPTQDPDGGPWRVVLQGAISVP